MAAADEGREGEYWKLSVIVSWSLVRDVKIQILKMKPRPKLAAVVEEALSEWLKQHRGTQKV